MTKTLSPLAVGTILYNIVDSTVGIIPVTRVDPELDQLAEEWKGAAPSKSKKSRSAAPPGKAVATEEGPGKAFDNDIEVSSDGSGPHGSKMIEALVYYGSMGKPKAYRPDEMGGLPVGIQIVGRPFDDEKTLALMSLIDDLLGKRGFEPRLSSKWI